MACIMFTAYKHPPEQHLYSSRDLHRQIWCDGCVRPSGLPGNAACDGWRRLDICGTLAVWFRHSAWRVQRWWSWAQDKRITAHGCIPDPCQQPAHCKAHPGVSWHRVQPHLLFHREDQGLASLRGLNLGAGDLWPGGNIWWSAWVKNEPRETLVTFARWYGPTGWSAAQSNGGGSGIDSASPCRCSLWWQWILHFGNFSRTGLESSMFFCWLAHGFWYQVGFYLDVSTPDLCFC